VTKKDELDCAYNIERIARTPLMHAAQHADVSMLKLLVGRGARLHDVDGVRYTATIYALRAERPSNSPYLKSLGLVAPPDLEAAFAICCARGFRVMAHATNPEAVKKAVRLGAHSVEYGYIMDQECVEQLRANNTWYVPTLAISHLTPDQASDPWEKRWVEQRNLSADLCERADQASGEHREWFRQALAAGVRMALGSDIRPLKEAALLELGLWVKDGATPRQALLAATRDAAELCGVGAELGTIQPGKLADLIVVDGDPLQDIANLRRLRLVFKEGRLVSDRRAAAIGRRQDP